MAEFNSDGVAAEIAKQMDTFAASLKGVGATLKDINKLVSANIMNLQLFRLGLVDLLLILMTTQKQH
jgi:ABC-type transporter Mla subunit MlaD